ncbi:alkaline phosphatase family protein [Microbacterium sp. ARD31]|uniref:alkaline phosphatase family protein n=1 Tax=Microbacterium sp. ARD31 TaxID=2962576 RepID=UPI002881D1B2|nr:alkaline phosphatase family protein [Microbacterium sp. ARD31]MDT0178915.1 alkaline phosphatase family protein [Microbacterium sp. ARD31]
MTASLPADPPTARSLTGVVPQILASLQGRGEWFAPARSAIVVMVDGLGRSNLTARAGYARFLAGRMTKKDAARTVFPATTAAALTSLLTGESPGRHGLVGYRVRVPGTDLAPNQLKGWETDGLDPLTWQRCAPILERETAAGRPCFVVSSPRYAATGFTRALQRGAEFIGATTIAERMERSADLALRHPGALVYTYIPELDTIAHARGWESDEWSAALETVDVAARDLDTAMGAHAGAVVTADHGVVDVPRHRHLLLQDGDPLVDDVRIVGGEPRMLHLYAEEGRADDVLRRWHEAESGRSWVLSRDEAVAAGLFGEVVDAEVLPRIGDVLVAARSAVAYYDDRESDKRPQSMIGQHGSLTDQERVVPMVRLGSFA